MLNNCFRFAPRDSVVGLIAKICRYLKEHPGWSKEEINEQIRQFIQQTGVESFNGRTGDVVLTESDVNNLKIAPVYFTEDDETIEELDLVELYNQGVRFVFTNWNSISSSYDLAFVLEYFSDSDNVVYYPMATGSGGVESFNGRTGAVMLTENDVNNLKIATAYFAEGDETIDELDLVELYNQGVRFVLTNWNSASSSYDLTFVLEYFGGSNDVVYYPMSTGSGGSNVMSVNGKTGVVVLSISDILGDSSAQVKLCTATEFTSNTITTWNAYYDAGYRIVAVVNNDSSAIDYFYILKQDENNHQPIMFSGNSSGNVTSVNNKDGNVVLSVVDVSENDSQDVFAKIFINESEEYPNTPADDSYKLGGVAAAEYLKKSQVVNDFTTTEEGFVADARALKELYYKFKHIIWYSPLTTMSFTAGQTVSFEIENCLDAKGLTPIAVLDTTSSKPLFISNHWGSGTTKYVRITNLSGVALTDISVRVVCINLDGI